MDRKTKELDPGILPKILEIILEKIKTSSLEDLNTGLVNIYMFYLSVRRFNSLSMGWFGPLALKLAEVPSQDNTSVTVGIMNNTIELPNSQTIGLAMLGFLGALSIIDGLKGLTGDKVGFFDITGRNNPLNPFRNVPVSAAEEAQRQFIEDTGMSFDDYLKARSVR